MKAKFIRLFVLIAVISAIFSASACTFINNGGESEITPSDDTVPYSVITNNSSTETLKNSIELSNNVTFPSSSTEKKSSYNEVLKETEVNRAVVTVYCVYNNSGSIGSGVIVDVDDGVNYGDLEDNIFYVITCNHVISDLSNYENHSITIFVPDEEGDNYDDGDVYDTGFKFSGYIGGSVLTARSKAVSLVGGCKEADIAVLRLYVENDTVAGKIKKAKVMQSDNSLKLGESVFAIGNPQGDHMGWVSGGIIADKTVTANVEDIGEMNLVGIDVNTQPGNSGGGLFNMKGELVGITNSGDAVSISGSSVGVGLNCAIPHKISADAAKDRGFINVTKQLIGTYLSAQDNYGYVSGKMKFGFTVNQTGSSLVVSSVSSGSIAYLAGLKANDVINSISVNGGAAVNLSNISEFDEILSSVAVGDTVYFYLSRTSGSRTRNGTISMKVYQYYFCDTGNYTGISQV